MRVMILLFTSIKVQFSISKYYCFRKLKSEVSCYFVDFMKSVSLNLRPICYAWHFAIHICLIWRGLMITELYLPCSEALKGKALTLAKRTSESRYYLSSKCWRNCSEEVHLTSTAPVQQLNTTEALKDDTREHDWLPATKTERLNSKGQNIFSQQHTEVSLWIDAQP